MIDVITSIFNLIAGLLCILNIYRVVKDKEVKGIAWVPIAFFTLYGCWNLYFYSVIGLKLSFIGGSLILLCNLIWLILVIKYKLKSKKNTFYIYTLKK